MGEPLAETSLEDELSTATPLVLIHSRRELAHRFGSGLEVTLYWCAWDNSTSVQVHQSTPEETLFFTVAREHALDAFYHPFAYLSGGT